MFRTLRTRYGQFTGVHFGPRHARRNSDHLTPANEDGPAEDPSRLFDVRVAAPQVQPLAFGKPVTLLLRLRGQLP